jgi:hypothetical protein
MTSFGAIMATVRRQLGMLKYEILEESRARCGTLRQQQEWGLIHPQGLAHGLIGAADLATRLGLTSVTVCEFGVATGNGRGCGWTIPISPPPMPGAASCWPSRNSTVITRSGRSIVTAVSSGVPTRDRDRG